MSAEQGLVDVLERSAAPFLSDLDLMVGRKEFDETHPCIEVIWRGRGPSIENGDRCPAIPA